MTRYLYILSILCTVYIQHVQAQNAYFPTKGIITYEREVYARARVREMSADMSRQNQGMMMRFGSGNIDDIPEKNSSMFMLQFDQDETVMQTVETEENEAANSGRGFGGGAGGGGRGNRSGAAGGRSGGGAGRNQQGGAGRIMRSGTQEKIFYQNLEDGSSEIQLTIDEKYILKDSLQQITWRFTNEYREIAGYECRRVNGATPDSLYIVAFYTDQIPISGGPALVHGLPGMILGIAIPEMHINYWARKVDFVVDNVPKTWRDKKSKEMTAESFFKSLENNRMFGGRGGNRNQTRRNLLENVIY